MSEGATRDNGLEAPAYVAVADIDPSVGDALLSALRRARIAAYLEPMSSPEESSRQRLYVAADERTDARSVIEVAARSFAHDAMAARRPDLLAGVDAQAEFDALVGDWHVDTLNAVRAAERDLTREDADWRMRLEFPPPGGRRLGGCGGNCRPRGLRPTMTITMCHRRPRPCRAWPARRFSRSWW